MTVHGLAHILLFLGLGFFCVGSPSPVVLAATNQDLLDRKCWPVETLQLLGISRFIFQRSGLPIRLRTLKASRHL